MRLTNKKELDRLIKRGLISKDQVAIAKKALRSTQTQQKNASPFCEFPPPRTSKGDPQSILAHGLIRAFGCYYHGGEVVLELECIKGRKYRADIALPRYRIIIEVDGWQYHSRLKSFQKDRDKSLALFSEGWRTLNVSNKQIKEDFEAIERAIVAAKKYSIYDPSITVKRIGFDRSRVVEQQNEEE